MVQVLIKTRDLDTDDRAIATVEVDRVPDNPMRQEQHLAEVVRQLHPEARQRSFEDGIASYVASQHLIIARYCDGAETIEEGETPVPDRQDQLFAA